jgi:hypothetical protein
MKMLESELGVMKFCAMTLENANIPDVHEYVCNMVQFSLLSAEEPTKPDMEKGFKRTI